MLPRSPRLLHEVLSFSAELQPDKNVLVTAGEGYSYRTLCDAARRLAGALLGRGLQRGERVAIYMDNGFACAASLFATSYAGGVFLIINPQTKADKLAYILRDSGAVLLLTEFALADQFTGILAECPDLKGVLVTDAGDIPEAGVPIEDWRQAVDSAPGAVDSGCGAIGTDLAALIYTSGSTGRPKGVMQTHQSMLFATDSLVEYLRLSDEHILLNVLPLAFDYGLYQLFMAVRIGATLVLERSFSYPGEVLKRINECEVSVFPGVPTIFSMLLSLYRRRPFQLPSVQRVTNTAAALPPEFVPQLRKVFPSALIYSMYGLTECKRVSYLEPELLERKPNSVGKAIPGTEVFLLTPEGKPVEPGEMGILHVRGPHLMQGYWRQPEQTEKMLKPGRWPGERVLCTHDWFRRDEQGDLYFLARSDDIIKTRGEKVSPREVEDALYAIEGVAEAAVIGVPDAVLGQCVRAYVVRAAGADLSDRDVKSACASRLENYMVPKEVVFVAELPKTSSGKIRRSGLLELDDAPAQAGAPV